VGLGPAFWTRLGGIRWFPDLGLRHRHDCLGMTTAIDDDLDLPEDQQRAIEPFGRYGLAGRGLGVSLVGIYWMAAAIQGEPSKADELGGALQEIQVNSKGWLLLLTLGRRAAWFDPQPPFTTSPTTHRGDREADIRRPRRGGPGAMIAY
jgi:hypothetical protein